MITKEELIEYICKNVDDFHFNKDHYSVPGYKYDYRNGGVDFSDVVNLQCMDSLIQYIDGEMLTPSACISMVQDKNKIQVHVGRFSVEKEAESSVCLKGIPVQLSREQSKVISEAFISYFKITNCSCEQESLNNTTLI